MANKYVRSTDGANGDDGSTWALARANLKDMAAASAAGDTIYLSQAHAEINPAATTITFPGTVTNPCTALAANDAAEPPTAGATASISTTGASNLLVLGSAYVNGITFNGGVSGASFVVLGINTAGASNSIQTHENCNVFLNDTHSSSEIRLGSDGGMVSETNMFNCQFKLVQANQLFRLRGKVRIVGGSFASGSVTPTAGLFSLHGAGAPTIFSIEDFDFSNLASTLKLFVTPGTNLPAFGKLRNCKLPASWTGSLVGGTFTTPNTRIEMWNCDAGDTNYKLWVEATAGSVRDEETIVMTGGASDGVTTYSQKMVSNANASPVGYRLESTELSFWCDSVGSSKTAKVEIIHDSATPLTNAEVYLELDYLGNAASTLGIPKTNRRVDIFASAADQATSSATWTTTGMTNPNKQKLEVTFTPQKVGWVQARVVLVKPSKTIYVNSALTGA